ncbi:XRE family transcriptional regulator [Exiguobacterium sp. RIT452]|nr:XRE family transcriptional regulator [Exiguobacterium sp. RIT452]
MEKELTLKEKSMNSLNISIGNEIKRIRQERNWTQSELCRGICSQAEISKIENGRNSPTVDLLQQIAERLEVPISNLLENKAEIETFNRFDHMLLKLTREGHYDQIQKYEVQKSDSISSETTLLLEYYRIISDYRMDKFDYRTTSVKLSRLTEEGELKFESPGLYLRIKMALAILYAENFDYKQAEKIYADLEDLDFRNDIEMRTQQLKIIYNHAKLLFKVGKFDKGLTVTQEGIQLSVHLHNFSYMAHLYYQKGEFFEELYGLEANTCQSYMMAYELFSAFQMFRYADIVKDVKKKFLFSSITKTE